MKHYFSFFPRLTSVKVAKAKISLKINKLWIQQSKKFEEKQVLENHY